MSDIFREVEEDVRRERFEKLWQTYGSYAIMALVLLFVGIGGYEFWQTRQSHARVQASDAFVAAEGVNNAMQAAGTFADLSKTAPGGYGLLAKLAQANAMMSANQQANAIAVYKEIAAQDSTAVGPVARLRAAWAMVDTTDAKTLRDWLAPLNDPASAWRQMAQEVLAYADYRAGNLKAAASTYNTLAADPQSPEALRARAKAMAAYLAEGGAPNSDKDFGTVPAPVAVTPGSALPQPVAPPAQ